MPWLAVNSSAGVPSPCRTAPSRALVASAARCACISQGAPPLPFDPTLGSQRSTSGPSRCSELSSVAPSPGVRGPKKVNRRERPAAPVSAVHHGMSIAGVLLDRIEDDAADRVLDIELILE